MCLTLTLATPAQANQQEMRERQCRYQWVDKGAWTAREEARTARCVVARWSVPGGLEAFDRIISCESGWNREAYNPSGPYVGLGQHDLGSWASRFRSYDPEWWHLSSRWQNSRTMLTITARMMHSVGLSPWSCA
jgi:hypothetical protein